MTIQDLNKEEHYISSLTKDNKEYDASIIEYIFLDNNEYYSISTDYYLFIDVGNMPVYIQTDWIEKHKSKLSLYVLNEHIKNENNKLDLFYNIEDRNMIQRTINNLISIRRDFIINGIL